MAGVPALGLESHPHMETAGCQRIPDHHRRGGSSHGAVPVPGRLHRRVGGGTDQGTTRSHQGSHASTAGPGGQDRGGCYPFGGYDVLVIFEAPDDTPAASVALAVAADGATRSAKATRLLSGQEWIDSLRKAQGSGDQPAREPRIRQP